MARRHSDNHLLGMIVESVSPSTYRVLFFTAGIEDASSAARLLSEQGVEVRAASDVEQASSLLRDSVFDVIWVSARKDAVDLDRFLSEARARQPDAILMVVPASEKAH